MRRSSSWLLGAVSALAAAGAAPAACGVRSSDALPCDAAAAADASATEDATTWNYTYDPNGNRTSGYDANGAAIPGANITYDNQDRLLRWGDYSYTYDHAGTLTSRTNASSGELVTYVYDLTGNLVSVALSTGKTITYKIDAYGRRIARVADLDGSGSQYQPTTTRYLYNNASQLVTMVDDAGTMSQFVYGTNPRVPDLMVRNANTYRIITDHLGRLAHHTLQEYPRRAAREADCRHSVAASLGSAAG